MIHGVKSLRRQSGVRKLAVNFEGTKGLFETQPPPVWPVMLAGSALQWPQHRTVTTKASVGVENSSLVDCGACEAG